MNVVVTGADGFIGRRVVAALARTEYRVARVVRATSEAELRSALSDADALIHLAGVNRPLTEEGYEENALFAARVAAATDPRRSPVVLVSSSEQATLENPYGRSKRAAEAVFEELGRAGARVAIYRLPNVFGPGARPNYNSAVATFAHDAARGRVLQVHDADRELTLIYVHDVAKELATRLDSPPPVGVSYPRVGPLYHITVAALAATFRGFAEARSTFAWPEIGSELERRLYASFLAAMPEDGLAYDLRIISDARGELAEFLKSPRSGQLFVSRTRAGVTRGNHFHYTKTEKFLVLAGDALIRLRGADGTGSIHCYSVSGRDFRVVDIPPDHTHSIENVGSEDLVVLFWASEILDPDASDTHPLNVLAT